MKNYAVAINNSMIYVMNPFSLPLYTAFLTGRHANLVESA